MNANIFEKTNQIIKTCDAAYLGVIDESGCPSVSTVSVIKPENIFEAYFSTNLDGNKAKRLLKNNKASICYRAGGNNITLVGEAEVLTDQETKSRYWLDWFKEHYSGGETDPTYCIIKFTTKRVSLWVDNEGADFTIDEFMTVQSRCGLLCNGCNAFLRCECSGCIALNGKASWRDGDCAESRCCINKGYAHCGECSDFPCDGIVGMSCGDDDECDKPPGARIAVCRAWAEKIPT